MSLFGWSLTKTQELNKYRTITYRLGEVRRWFAGWKDLDVIVEYVCDDQKSCWGGIENLRRTYAKLRNTDEYGRTKE